VVSLRRCAAGAPPHGGTSVPVPDLLSVVAREF